MGVPSGNLSRNDAGTQSIVNMAFNGTVRTASPSCTPHILTSVCLPYRADWVEVENAHFDTPRSYHTQTLTWESGWGNSIHDDSLGYGPFCEQFVLFAGPPVWFHLAGLTSSRKKGIKKSECSSLDKIGCWMAIEQYGLIVNRASLLIMVNNIVSCRIENSYRIDQFISSEHVPSELLPPNHSIVIYRIQQQY